MEHPDPNTMAQSLINIMDGINIANHNEVDFTEKRQCDRCGHFPDNDLIDVYWFYDEYKEELLKCDESYKKAMRISWDNLYARALSRQLFSKADGF